jgi:hypothetical protein
MREFARSGSAGTTGSSVKNTGFPVFREPTDPVLNSPIDLYGSALYQSEGHSRVTCRIKANRLVRLPQRTETT